MGASSGSGEGKEEKKETKLSPEEHFQQTLAEAKQGDPKVLNRLGEMYLNGEGVAQNIELAIESFTSASKNKESPSAAAFFNLGRIYNENHDDQNKIKALESFIAAAHLGDAMGAVRASRILRDRVEFAIDISEKERIATLRNVESLLRPAAESGNPVAQFALGDFLKHNRDEHNQEYIEWFLKAADQGNGNAITEINQLSYNNDALAFHIESGKALFTLVSAEEKIWENKLRRLCLYSSYLASRKEPLSDASVKLNTLATEHPKIFDEFIRSLAEKNQFKKINQILTKRLSEEAEKAVRGRFSAEEKALLDKIAESETKDQTIFKHGGIVNIITSYTSLFEKDSQISLLNSALNIFEKHLAPLKENSEAADLVEKIRDLKNKFSLEEQQNLMNEIETAINKPSSSSSSSMYPPPPSALIQALEKAKKEISENEPDAFILLFPDDLPPLPKL